MKMENIAIVFALIMVPITLVFSAMMKAKTEALKLEIQYTKVLDTATYDAIKALEDNTSVYYINPEYVLSAEVAGGMTPAVSPAGIQWHEMTNGDFFQNYSTVADSLKRSTEAMINTFMTGISMNMVGSATSKGRETTYAGNIPAIVVVMYNGYYIYSPDIVGGALEHTLKPFAFYSQQYNLAGTKHAYGKPDLITGSVVVNYGLDNFVTVFTSKGPYSGYIVDTTRYINAGVAITIDGIPIDDYENFYKNAIDFSSWFNGLNLSTKQFIPGSPINNMTTFNEEKREVIKNSINTSLAMAIANYNNISSGDYVFQIPNLSETDWDIALSNISIITFLQGMPIKTRSYNNYSIAASTESRTSFYINKKDIFFEYGTTNTKFDGDTYPQTLYHRIDCPDLTPNADNANASKYYWETFEGTYNPGIVDTVGYADDPYGLNNALGNFFGSGNPVDNNKSIRKLFPKHFQPSTLDASTGTHSKDRNGTEIKYITPSEVPQYAAHSCILNQNYTRHVDAEGVPDSSLSNATRAAYYQALARVLTENDKNSKRFNF